MARGITGLAVLFLFASACASTPSGGSIAPGTYSDWQGIDRVEILETFRFGDYSRVLVGPFDTSRTPLPDESDNAYQPVQDVLRDVAFPLIEGFQDSNAAGLRIERAEAGSDPGAPGTLIFRGVVTEMAPGSRAARYWVGFGAGATRAEIDGEVVDAASGRVLFRFTQARRSGVGHVNPGGDYVKLMRRDLRWIGRDVGNALGAFR